MKLKKIIAFTNNRQIWRLLISDNNRLLIEERDTDKKEVFYDLVDIPSGKIIWKDFQLEEKYWVGVEAVYKDVIIFHKYGKPDMPMHKELFIHALEDKKLLWSSDKYEFLFVYDDKIFCIKRGFEKHNYFSLKYHSGEPAEDYENDYLAVNELRNKANEKDNFEGYLYAESYSNNAKLPQSSKDIINNTIIKFDIAGKPEYLKINDYILFNFHHKNKTGQLTNRFYAFDEIKQKCILDEVLIENTNAFVPDSFFMKDGFLFLLKEKKSLIIYSI
jgi:hypothetical protein